MNDGEVLEELKNGSSEALTLVYQTYRNEFINWSVSRYSISRDDAKDIYQTCILLFYENILAKKLTTLNSSLKTYLFSIGKNKIREQLRASGRVQAGELQQELPDMPAENSGDPENEKYYALFKECLDELGDPCKSVLVSFYYKNFTMSEIAEAFNYKNEATAKNSKYKFLQQLKQCFFKKLGDNSPVNR